MITLHGLETIEKFFQIKEAGHIDMENGDDYFIIY
jgi:hypothetical protein